MESKTNLLQLNKITKIFPGVIAVDKVDFDMNRGEIHALVGENGAGKSTLIKILGGVYQPDGGKVIFDGEEVFFDTLESGNPSAMSGGVSAPRGKATR